MTTCTTSGNDHCWCHAVSSVIRDKGGLFSDGASSWNDVDEGRGRFWAVAGHVANHGCQRPLPTHIHSGDIRYVCPMACFAVV